ncbi:YY1-associated factor 2 [Macrosteles quadrilineatus]|uniref:YY1-associated factor 2 n=1 Tax=Macrosteles quadrilineatus TaxID=74068 RepID=UPI0023E09B5F|nr:YY1-associated factor 2 [Macrosteles quadrilineatus]
MAIMSGRTKRQAKVLEENYWDCSVCTYRNTAEAFKCLMCDVRKGTSTRKPRINPQLAAQQYAPVIPQKSNKSENGQKEKSEKKNSPHRRRAWSTPRLKNVDRSTAQTREVTVNNITVLITEYKPKVNNSQDQLEQSSVSSETGSHSESSADAQTDTDSPSS